MKHRNAIRLTAAALCLCLAAACLYPSAQAAPAGSPNVKYFLRKSYKKI